MGRSDVMKIAVIGGGPAGLYFAILMKKQRPSAAITVYQRITQEFAYWDDIAIHFKGEEHRIGGNGFCGCSRRSLLLILQERARDLGVDLVFQADVDDEAQFADADLIVLADGINSRFRERHAEH